MEQVKEKQRDNTDRKLSKILRHVKQKDRLPLMFKTLTPYAKSLANERLLPR
jgi:hypothetical protein